MNEQFCKFSVDFVVL